jgi:hypothetical protein
LLCFASNARKDSNQPSPQQSSGLSRPSANLFYIDTLCSAQLPSLRGGAGCTGRTKDIGEERSVGMRFWSFVEGGRFGCSALWPETARGWSEARTSVSAAMRGSIKSKNAHADSKVRRWCGKTSSLRSLRRRIVQEMVLKDAQISAK